MLQIKGNTVQDRFLSAVQSLRLKFPIATIAKETGYGEPTVSVYLNKKEPSEKFIKSFCESFGFDFEAVWKGVKPEYLSRKSDKVPYTDSPGEAITSIARSNEVLSQANKKIAESNYDLVQMLKKATANVPSETSLIGQSKLAEVLVLIAQIGSGQKKWDSFEEALAEVHKYVDA